MTHMMEELIIPIICVASIVGSVGIITIILVLRDKITGVYVNRKGMEITTNDLPEWSGIVDYIERIDSNSERAIRKGTSSMTILDPEKYGTEAEVMLVNWKANQPLIYAAYENHHTREISTDVNVYIEDQIQDVQEAVRIEARHIEDLTSTRIDSFVGFWFKRILLPNVKKACNEKIAYYKLKLADRHVSQTLKTILAECLQKNEGYITLIEELLIRPDITGKSSIFYPVK